MYACKYMWLRLDVVYVAVSCTYLRTHATCGGMTRVTSSSKGSGGKWTKISTRIVSTYMYYMYVYTHTYILHERMYVYITYERMYACDYEYICILYAYLYTYIRSYI